MQSFFGSFPGVHNLNDMVAIATYIKRDGMSDEDTLKNSYFVSGISRVEL